MTEERELLDEAREAASRSYSPYSDLRVGAVVVAKSGARYQGANVENAAYGSSLCAEAVAIGTAIAAGERELETVAVISPDLPAIYPCGECRQHMVEFGVQRVILEGADGEPVEQPLEVLLPGGFTDWRQPTAQ